MAAVSPSIQRQVQGIASVQPSQKAVRSGGALAGALARTQVEDRLGGFRTGRTLQRQREKLSDVRRERKQTRTDVKAANVLGAVNVAAGAASAWDRAVLAEQNKRRDEEVNFQFNALIEFMNSQPAEMERIIQKHAGQIKPLDTSAAANIK